jgi:O-antigen/teichoic acid export membrane protein
MISLKQKSINGMLWTVSERFSVQAVQLLVQIVLARLLEPAQFGLIGMLLIFIAVTQSIMDSGFGSALIQKKDADQTDSSSIFFFNLLLGVVLASILFLTAPLIAQFYLQPELIPITRVLSLTLVINAFSLVQTSLLAKKLDFKTQMKISFLAMIISGVIGIAMAYQGFGVWSLVAQLVSKSLFQAIFLWLFNDWRPSAAFSYLSLRSMFSFGSKLLISGLIDTTFNNIYQMFIGKVYSPADLGYYSKAKSVELTAIQATSSSLGQVLFPSMVHLQNDLDSLKKAYRKTIRLSLFLHFPLMIGLWAVADPLFRLLLTDKWAPSIPYFQILCIAALLYPLQVLNLNILKVKGRSDLFLKLEIIKKATVVLAIVLTYRHGIIVMLYGQIITSIISYLLNSYYSGVLIGYSQWDQIKDLVPSFGSAVIMGIVMYLVGLLPNESHLLKILFQTITGMLVYYLISLKASSSELAEVKSIVINAMIQIILKLKGALCRTR